MSKNVGARCSVPQIRNIDVAAVIDRHKINCKRRPLVAHTIFGGNNVK